MPMGRKGAAFSFSLLGGRKKSSSSVRTAARGPDASLRSELSYSRTRGEGEGCATGSWAEERLICPRAITPSELARSKEGLAVGERGGPATGPDGVAAGYRGRGGEKGALSLILSTRKRRTCRLLYLFSHLRGREELGFYRFGRGSGRIAPLLLPPGKKREEGVASALTPLRPEGGRARNTEPFSLGGGGEAFLYSDRGRNRRASRSLPRRSKKKRTRAVLAPSQGRTDRKRGQLLSHTPCERRGAPSVARDRQARSSRLLSLSREK